MNAPVSPAPAQAVQFVEALAPGGQVLHFRVIHPITGVAENAKGAFVALHAQLAARNAAGAGVYVVINGGGTTKGEINEIRAFSIDYDSPTRTREELDAHLSRCPLPPSIIVESSTGKWHVYWLVSDYPLDLIDGYDHCLNGFIAYMQGDPNANKRTQLLRVPGFYHTKGKPFLSRLVECRPELRYRWEDMWTWLSSVVPPPPPPIASLSPPSPSTDDSQRYAQAALGKAVETVRETPEGSRNVELNRQAIGPYGLAKGGHISVDTVTEYLTCAAMEAGLDEAEIVRTLRSAERAADPRGVPGPLDAAGAFTVAPDVAGGFEQFTLRESAEAMEARMQTDSFVIGRLAILGQLTVFYGGPNMGKTLLTLWLLARQIEAEAVDPKTIYYINADDNSRGLMEKQRIAQRRGFSQLAPGHAGFKAKMLVALMQLEAQRGTAQGCIIVLDTLKKFTDLMDKKEASAFGRAAREFVSAGGTVIGLAHVNKHKDFEGKSVHAGTTDIKDDADCVYILDDVGQAGGEQVVMFRNEKDRGDVAQTAYYAFASKDGHLSRVIRVGAGSNGRGGAGGVPTAVHCR